MKKDLARFTDIIIDEEEIVNTCRKCRRATELTQIPYEGIGAIANSMTYMYCSSCDLYYMYQDTEDNHE